MISLFPEIFQGLSYGITGRAMKNDLLKITHTNPRDYTRDKHRTVDDTPYGGGPGMLMKYQPLKSALDDVLINTDEHNKPLVIYLSPQGVPLQQAKLIDLAKQKHMVLICGRYEGIDERFIDSYGYHIFPRLR